MVSVRLSRVEPQGLQFEVTFEQVEVSITLIKPTLGATQALCVALASELETSQGHHLGACQFYASYDDSAVLVSPIHKRTEGRAPVRGTEFTI